MKFIHEIFEKHSFDTVLGGAWPGIQLYYPPIKYNPINQSYETMEEARQRLVKHGLKTEAHTLLFDLEDGCRQKEMSRELLKAELHNFKNVPFQIAIRINQFRTPEYKEDLNLIRQVADYVDVIILAKAGELYGAAEIRDLSAWIKSVNEKITIQPIIEHPRSLKLASELMNDDSVKHVVFGIHDFSKAMAIHLTPYNWPEKLKTYLDILIFEARIAGKGVIGAVEPLISPLIMPSECEEEKDVRRWLDLHGDDVCKVVYAHASNEASIGLTGKQVIHPNHIHLCSVAFTPSFGEIERNIKILKEAVKADALIGGAIKFEGEMLDPPMFGKSLQTLLRANALKVLKEEEKQFVVQILELLPLHVIRENWPYGIL